jgi:hypothetical protein
MPISGLIQNKRVMEPLGNFLKPASSTGTIVTIHTSDLVSTTPVRADRNKRILESLMNKATETARVKVAVVAVFSPENSEDPTSGSIFVTGESGPTGESGLKGEAGLAGPCGIKGEAGPAGPSGLKGEVGSVGPSGLKGEVGPIGLSGPSGLKGEVGPIGLSGPSGLKGEVGPIGPSGPSGLKGEAGKPGLNLAKSFFSECNTELTVSGEFASEVIFDGKDLECGIVLEEGCWFLNVQSYFFSNETASAVVDLEINGDTNLGGGGIPTLFCLSTVSTTTAVINGPAEVKIIRRATTQETCNIGETFVMCQLLHCGNHFQPQLKIKRPLLASQNIVGSLPAKSFGSLPAKSFGSLPAKSFGSLPLSAAPNSFGSLPLLPPRPNR